MVFVMKRKTLFKSMNRNDLRQLYFLELTEISYWIPVRIWMTFIFKFNLNPYEWKLELRSWWRNISNKCSKIMKKQPNKGKINVNNFLWNELRKWRLPLAFGICGGKFLYILWIPFLLEHDFSRALLLTKRKNQKN